MAYNNYNNKPLPATLGSATYRLVAKALQGKLDNQVKAAVLEYYNGGAKNNFLKNNKSAQNKVLASLKKYGQDVEDKKFFNRYWQRVNATKRRSNTTNNRNHKPSLRHGLSEGNLSKIKLNEIFA